MDELLLSASRFRVVRRMIQIGEAEPVAKELVIHPGAAAILPVLPDGRVILVRNWRWSINRELLELPAGTLEPLEKPDVCARRELEEETGYRAGRITPLVRFYTSPGVMTELMNVFVASDLTAGEQNLSQDEKISVAELTWDEIDEAIRNLRIMDGKTLAALLYYRFYWNAEGR